MASIAVAIDFAMRQWDPILTGAIVNDPNDRRGMRRYGIPKSTSPDLAAAGFYDSVFIDGQIQPKILATEALPMAQKAASSQYETSLMIAGMNSQQVADSILTLAFSEGSAEAITMLERTVSSLNQTVPTKGFWDFRQTFRYQTITTAVFSESLLASVNALAPEKLLPVLTSFATAYFNAVVKAIPSQSVNLPFWSKMIANIAALATPVTT